MNWGGVLLLWLILMVAETIHGIARGIFLVPRVGNHRASQIGIFTGSLLIGLITWLGLPWMGATGANQYLAVGGLWAFLTLLFELALGRWVFKYSWQRIGAEFNLPRGGLMPLGLLFMALCPWLVWWLGHR